MGFDMEKFKSFLKNTPKEKLKKTWESGNYLDKGGIKVIEYLRNKTNMQTEEWVKLQIPSLLSEHKRCKYIVNRKKLLQKGIKSLRESVRKNTKIKK